MLNVKEDIQGNFKIQNFTQKSKICTHKMQNASHLLQNEALHSKYHKHVSNANICLTLQTPLP